MRRQKTIKQSSDKKENKQDKIQDSSINFLLEQYGHLIEDSSDDSMQLASKSMQTLDKQKKTQIKEKTKRSKSQIKSNQQIKSIQQFKQKFQETIRQKAQRKFLPGQLALKQIKFYQKSPQMVIRKLPFQRLVRKISLSIISDRSQYDQDYQDYPVRFTSTSIQYLQNLTENYMTGILEDANICAAHAKRVTVMEKDILLARRIRGHQDPGYFDNNSIDIKSFL